jgi:glycosyltransferase involved in cell wall biosynthesis
VPGVLIEAGLAALPVVATDVGWVREVIVDGVTGVLVPPAPSAELAAAVRRVLAERDRMGRAARVRCLEQFEFGSVLEQ